MSQYRYGKFLSLQTNRSYENNGKVPTPTQRREQSGMDAITPSRPDPAGGADRRRLTAIVYGDLVGYSRLIGEDDAGTFARMGELRADLIDPAIARHGGRLVDAAGDSLLARIST
jgi:class 3 adenylate cyclase